MKTEAYYEADVAIVGGGIAGCVLAMALARSYSVVLIDKLEEPVSRVGECLAPAARRILRKLDLLDSIVEQNQHSGLYLPSLGAQSFWGSDTLHIVDHLKNPDGFSWHLNRKDFEMHLRKETAKREVQCIWGTTLLNSHHEDGRWKLALKPAAETDCKISGHISATFVVDASGRLSGFAKQLGVKRTHFDKLVAHWAILPDGEAARMSTISAAETGWWYSAPLPGNKRIMALHTDPDLTDRQMVKDDNWFIEAVKANREMSKIANAANSQINYRGVVAANSTRLDQVAGKQWAAVGDAAMSFDPLSSQGMFNAMAGALQLADLMLASGKSLSEPEMVTTLEKMYSLQMDNIWNHYTQHKNAFYTQEQRWKDAVFWRRRA